MPFLTSVRLTRLRANDTHCPASALATLALTKPNQPTLADVATAGYHMNPTYRFRSMDLITVLWKFPFESGPNNTASPALTVPEFKIPSMTVPTYGTE